MRLKVNPKSYMIKSNPGAYLMLLKTVRLLNNLFCEMGLFLPTPQFYGSTAVLILHLI